MSALMDMVVALAFAERITFRALTLLRSLADVESSESESYQLSRFSPNHAVVISAERRELPVGASLSERSRMNRAGAGRNRP